MGLIRVLGVTFVVGVEVWWNCVDGDVDVNDREYR